MEHFRTQKIITTHDFEIKQPPEVGPKEYLKATDDALR